MVLTLLAPPLLNLCLSDVESIAILDISEEESSEKGEKDKEEKILQFSIFMTNDSSMEVRRSHSNYYLEIYSNHASEIHLPPPEQFI